MTGTASDLAATATVPLLYADEVVAVVDKPSGLAVHRGWAPEADVLVARLTRQLARPVHPAHRLDRGTSGALLVAFDAATARRLGDAFAARAIDKVYLALVRGAPPEDALIDHPIPAGEEPGAARVAATTRVRRLATFGRYALVEASPLTGRLHQVRRHLKHLSCPIIGDVNYGKGEHNRYFREQHGLHRLFLHAARITLPHPTTGAELSVVAPLPPELARVLDALGADRTALGVR